MCLLLRRLVAPGRIADLLQLGRHRLPCVPQDLHKVACVGLLVLHALGVRAEEADGEALLARAPGPADPVHVVLNGEGEGVVDHQLHVLHVQATARHVRGDKRGLPRGLEVRDRQAPLVLRHVALQRNHLVEALLPQEGLQPRRLLLVEAEHDDLLLRGEVLLQGREEARGLVLLVVQHLDLLADRGVGDETLVQGADADVHGLVQELRGQRVHGGWPRGAEHASLPLGNLGHPADERLHHVDEAHVQHAVRLVEHEVLHVAEVQGALVGEVLQAARRGDEHVHALRLQGLPLLPLGHAAVDALHREVDAVGLQRLGQVLADLGDLHGQLARRREGHEARHVRRLLEDRQHASPGHGQVGHGEGHGLAAARLRDATDVALLHGDGPAARLDRRGLLELALAVLD
mmetsp:Transcript_37812/g.97802  ORF Transcript_37812/g.97802 Transcript_37812/m.97802 type:complete len:404 (+) Transcript_37812:176-1387(+)